MRGEGTVMHQRRGERDQEQGFTLDELSFPASHSSYGKVLLLQVAPSSSAGWRLWFPSSWIGIRPALPQNGRGKLYLHEHCLAEVCLKGVCRRNEPELDTLSRPA